jgi:hypothetical protein
MAPHGKGYDYGPLGYGNLLESIRNTALVSGAFLIGLIALLLLVK